jgi:hypothetical protein
MFGELLVETGFHSSGNEILYNGMDGTQVEMEIFVGPTYYMRLKHMVKDKINYRPQGPRSAITRQPVGGRANDGGLRIGKWNAIRCCRTVLPSFEESMLKEAINFIWRFVIIRVRRLLQLRQEFIYESYVGRSSELHDFSG